jgi:hypothetical protein
LEQKKGHFAAYIKDSGVMDWGVEFGRLENQPKRTPTEMAALRAIQRQKYQVSIDEQAVSGEEAAADDQEELDIVQYKVTPRNQTKNPDDEGYGW